MSRTWRVFTGALVGLLLSAVGAAAQSTSQSSQSSQSAPLVLSVVGATAQNSSQSSQSGQSSQSAPLVLSAVGATAQSSSQSGQSGQSGQSTAPVLSVVGATAQSGSQSAPPVLSAVGAAAQSTSQSGQSGQSGQSAPPAQQTDKDKAAGSTLSLDVPAPPPNPEEDAAFKAFDVLPLTDGDKKIKVGEDFVAKYPQSRYLPPVYSAMVKLYLQANQIQKMQEIGEKEVVISPNDVQTLALLAQTLPRSWSSSMPNAQQQLDKAEKFSKSAIELTPTLPKPDAMTDAQFTMAKNQTLAMAHSGLGLVYFRRGKFAEAIPEFEQANKVDPDPQPDPVNYYILGIANEKTSHFDDAAAAFTKCAGINSSLQATCKTGADEAKKLGATQLSAPK